MGQTLDLNPTFISPKSLARSGNRNAKVFALHKLEFPAKASLQLKTAARVLWRRVRALNEPVERIISTPQGDCVVKVHDDAALCAVTRALREVIDQRRVILRIPDPGRDNNAGVNGGPLLEMLPADIVQAGESVSEAMPASAAPEGK
jgi:hypothetical protein